VSQAAIAIDNAGLFDHLQRANTELMLAYDSTIEGWARALELRDIETEGHTRRGSGSHAPEWTEIDLGTEYVISEVKLFDQPDSRGRNSARPQSQRTVH
jgi:hypothetical protein